MIEFDPILVHDWLYRTARLLPDKEALVCGQDRWTYKKIDLYSSHLAGALVNMGVQRQDRVVVLLDNSAETVISLYGILKVGGVFVILASSVKGRKLRYVLKNSGANVLITHTSKARVVEDALDSDLKLRKLIWVGTTKAIPSRFASDSLSWDDIFSELSATGAEYPDRRTLPRSIDVDLASLIYTSGSTGEPKGVVSTHQNMISAGKSIIQYIGNTQDDVILNVLPLSFGYGLYQVIMSCMFGGTVVLERSFLYPHVKLERIAAERVTGLPLVPSMAAMMLQMQNINEYNFSTLRYITSAGAALPIRHLRSLRKLVPQAKIFNMFGLTECVRASYLVAEELDQRPSSVGKAIPNCEVFIVDEAGNEVELGEIGELAIRGSNVAQGYWNDPDMTGKVFKNGDYPVGRILYSGDYFKRDAEGFLYFVDRKDDMINSNAERISPKEVEDIIQNLDGVVEVAVVGVPDEILGQAIKAFIVPMNGTALTEKQVLRYCAANMETFMVPKYVQFVRELPKTLNGKVDKKALKAIGVEHNGY
ncbi:MAG: class I adenylate-forming enzyme family protein [Phycisphaerae bacterium]